MIPKFRIHGDGAELVPYTVPELFFLRADALCASTQRARATPSATGTTKSNYYM